jgi:predicted amidohydrolase
MRVALIVNQVTDNRYANLDNAIRLSYEAADHGAELLLFGEAAVTGLRINDNPQHDLPLGEPSNGWIANIFAKAAKERNVYIAFGFLEIEDNKLYDSALLLGRDGVVLLRYRRIQPQWHGKSADPKIYCQGDGIPSIKTEFGTAVILICGDLFEDSICNQARPLKPDFLLFPFARNFDDNSHDAGRWYKKELPYYAARAKMLNCPILMVNYLSNDKDDSCFGGACLVSASGEVLSYLPPGKTGILYATLPI